jgi:uncharacterized protein
MNAGRVSPAFASSGARLGIALAALLGTIVTTFALTFPALSGRVIDQANIIPPVIRSALTGKLADLEQKSGIQLVVATVTSLEGQEIEPYANQLFRTWQLGQKDKNDGVLLLVAPNEHRVRIEVGYGLEGTLTDALSKIIISNAITPRFKAGDFGGGIARGVDDIITVLTVDSADWQPRPALRLDSNKAFSPAIWLILLFVLILIYIVIWLLGMHRFLEAGPRHRSRRSHSSGSSWSSGWSIGSSSGSDSWSSSSSSSDSGGSFSGGGGSSGGGGASGSW